MDIIVTADPQHPQRGTLQFKGRVYPCVLGRSGVRAHKTEGDGATPVGRFPLRRVLYRPDRITALPTLLPKDALTRSAGWSDAPDEMDGCYPPVIFRARRHAGSAVATVRACCASG